MRGNRWMFVIGATLLLIVGAATGRTALAATSTHEYSIAAGQLGEALNQLAAQSHAQILYAPELVKGKMGKGLAGNYSVGDALQRLLQDSGLRGESVNDDTWVIRADAKPAAASAPASAGDPPPAKPPATLGAVQVLGSRIKKADMAEQTPVITISSEDIQSSGLASIGDVIQQLSISGSALNTKFNSSGNFGSPPDGTGLGAGATTISLRSLNPKRTLVLVDGLRWVNGSSASGVSAAVDLNTIPAGIIERIEILSDGASSLYGSDAIAGVINIITKKSQDGAAVRAYYGDYSMGNGKTWSGDLSFGGKGDRYQFFVNASHYDQQEISAGAWDRNSLCVPGTGMTTCSSATLLGRMLFNTPGANTFGGLCPGGYCNIAPNGVAGASGIQDFPGGFHKFTNADRYIYGPENLMLTPSTRSGLFASVNYNLTDNINLYFRGLYNSRKSMNQAAPEIMAVGQLFCTVGTRCAASSIDATNPYNPFGFTLNASDPKMGVARRPIEGGPRVYTQDVDTRYFAAGLTGTFEIGDRFFNWDANLVRTSNDAVQDTTGTYNNAHIEKALGPLAVCQADPACVPLNIFGGPGTITPKMLEYILYRPHDTSHQSMGVFTANISGDLLKLPAGWLDFATGYEHRSLSGDYQPDATKVAGEAGTPVQRTVGGYTVDEFYVELNVPLLADIPGVKSLNVDVASRYSDYSTFGGTVNSKAGFLWQVFKDLTFRGTWGQGFRAPSIGELFGPRSVFTPFITDPCNYNSPIMSAAVAANCKALGVPDPSTFVQARNQVPVFTGGNAGLQPERSRNLTLGSVYSPSWTEDTSWSRKLDFELTYYKVTLRNAIQVADAQSLVNRCAESLNARFCDLQSRSSAGYISFIEGSLQNLGRVDTSGFDFAVNWLGNDTRVGRFGASWQSTYVKDFRVTDTSSGLVEPGTTGVEVNNGVVSRLRSQVRVNWMIGDWTASWAVRYISAATEDCKTAGNFPVCSNRTPSKQFPNGSNHLGATAYNDARVTWKVPVKLPVTLSGGINNILDRQPPTCLSCSLNGYDASTYDLPGRFWYVTASMKF